MFKYKFSTLENFPSLSLNISALIQQSNFPSSCNYQSAVQSHTTAQSKCPQYIDSVLAALGALSQSHKWAWNTQQGGRHSSAVEINTQTHTHTDTHSQSQLTQTVVWVPLNQWSIVSRETWTEQNYHKELEGKSCVCLCVLTCKFTKKEKGELHHIHHAYSHFPFRHTIQIMAMSSHFHSESHTVRGGMKILIYSHKCKRRNSNKVFLK